MAWFSSYGGGRDKALCCLKVCGIRVDFCRFLHFRVRFSLKSIFSRFKNCFYLKILPSPLPTHLGVGRGEASLRVEEGWLSEEQAEC